MTADLGEAIGWLRRLVAFDTTSHRSNLAMIAEIRDHLGEHGIASRLIHNRDGTKASLLASVGPPVEGGIVLSGHTDVVPVAGQAWSSDPFEARERDGRIYGRGTADMKSFIAAVLALVPETAAAGLRVPIHLAFSYDEEVGCLGAPDLIARIRDDLPRPALAVIGEPTGMTVANAHKGVYAYRTEVTGREGHSSGPHRGANAIVAAAALIGRLDEFADRLRREPAPSAEFDPPYGTVNVGTIEGGSALNIIPRRCVFRWEHRPLPGADPAAAVRHLSEFAEATVVPRLRAVDPAAGVETAETVAVPPLLSEPGSPAVAFALALTGANRARAVSFASEAGLFQQAGIPAVLCGPGDIAQAHQPDEYIEIAQIEACLAFLRRLLARASAPGGTVGAAR